MPVNPPAIVKASATLMVAIEEAVRGFPRFHKYATGTRLRDLAWTVASVAHEAWTARDGRAACIDKLSRAIDDFKRALQLAQDVRAFKSFGQFEALARQVSALGRQCGGWQKKQRSNDQNRTAPAPPGRVEILSARDASLAGANP